MLAHLIALMAFQLAGELLVAALGIGFPGPLCGMLLLLGWLHIRGGPSEGFARTGAMITDHLGLLFVPAGAAIVNFGALLISDGPAIAAALILSTALAICVSGILGGICQLPAGNEVNE
jgi:holin-like protein